MPILRLLVRKPPNKLAKSDIEWLVGWPERVKKCESLNYEWLPRLITELAACKIGDADFSESKIAAIGIYCERPITAIAALMHFHVLS